MPAAVSIVIPSWNGLELLECFLTSVIEAAAKYQRQFNAGVEIIVVDDGSTDATAEWLYELGFEEQNGPGGRGSAKQEAQLTLRLICNATNRGFGPTCNRGLEAASYPLVFLLNNDVKVDVDSIAPLVENFADPSVFAAHCRVFDLESGREVGTGKIGSFSRGFIRVHRS